MTDFTVLDRVTPRPVQAHGQTQRFPAGILTQCDHRAEKKRPVTRDVSGGRLSPTQGYRSREPCPGTGTEVLEEAAEGPLGSGRRCGRR